MSLLESARGIPHDEMTPFTWVVWVAALVGIIAFIVWKRTRGK